MEGTYFEISLLLGLATLLAIVFRWAKQPPILSYILAGLILGPLNLVQHEGQLTIEFFAEIGITLLLFLLGLELKLSELRFVGKVAVLTGIGQIVFTSVIGFLISLLLGLEALSALYVAIALTFSSTIIIVKLLSDKKELGTLHGKIAVGMLLIQDFVAIIALVLLSGLTGLGADAQSPFIEVLVTVFKAIVMLVVMLLASRLVFPKLIHSLANSHEILFVFTLAWAFGIATIASSPIVGLSIEIGGFLAGLALANSIESFQIITKIRPLRDFFIVLFFINLGMGLQIDNLQAILPMALIFSIFVLIGNPLIVMLLMKMLGYQKQTSFKTGLTVAQISEFSLIVIYMAQRLGHVSDDIVSLVTLVGIITFVLSTYAILGSDYLYRIFSPYLGIFEPLKKNRGTQETVNNLSKHIVVVGANRIGMSIAHKLRKIEQPLIVIDYDPNIDKTLSDAGIAFLSGDIADSEVQEQAALTKAEVIVSTVPSVEDNILFITRLRKQGSKAKIIVSVHRSQYAEVLYSVGADYIIYPYSYIGNILGNIIKSKSYDRLEAYEV